MQKGFINKFFPVPGFLALSSVGFDISDQSIKYAGLIQKDGGLQLGKFGSIRLEPGIIKSGEIFDPLKLKKILSDFSKKENIKFVRVALSEQQIYLFTLFLPDMEYDVTYGAIELQLEEHIPIDANNVIFDFEILEKKDGKMMVQVVASPRSVVDNYISIIKDAGMTPLSIEVEGQAIARSVMKSGSNETAMIVDFGELRTGISVVSNESIHFTSTIDIGGISITKLIEKNFGISFEEAEELKQKTGLKKTIVHSDLFPVLLNGVSVLRDEINRHFVYWHTHKEENGQDRPHIEKIILCGGDSNLPGLKDYLSSSLRVKVEIADVWVNINSFGKYIPEINFNNSLGFATALGLALRDFNI